MEAIINRILDLIDKEVDIATMTLVLRSQGYADEEIAGAYDEIAEYSVTETVKGSHYIRLL